MQRSLKIFLLVLLFVIVFSLNIWAFTYTNSEGDEIEANYNDNSFYNDVDYNNPEIEWDQFDQSKVPPERINEIPSDKVNPTKVQDKSKLIAKQLVYQNPTTGKYNIDIANANELDPIERDKALKILGRTNEDVETETKQPSQITSYDDGFSIDNIDYIRIGDIKVFDGSGVSYRNNKFNIESASKIEIKDGLLTNVINFEGSAIEFSVGSAKDVLNGCVSARNVNDSDFRITDKTIEIMPKKGISFDISDCNFAQSTFESFSENSSIEIEKKQNATYKIKEGQLECYSISFTDRIEANNSAEVEYGSNCFSCMTINPAGSYWYSDESVIKDFAIDVPLESSGYRLCLERIDEQHKNESYDGLIGFYSKKITLNKIVNYLRLPFVLNDNLNENSANDYYDYYLMEPYTPVNVYEGKGRNNKAVMELDSDFLFIGSFFVENENPASAGVLSYVNSGKYAVYEYNHGDGNDYDENGINGSDGNSGYGDSSYGNEVRRHGRFNGEISGLTCRDVAGMYCLFI